MPQVILNIWKVWRDVMYLQRLCGTQQAYCILNTTNIPKNYTSSIYFIELSTKIILYSKLQKFEEHTSIFSTNFYSTEYLF